MFSKFLTALLVLSFSSTTLALGLSLPRYGSFSLARSVSLRSPQVIANETPLNLIRGLESNVLELASLPRKRAMPFGSTKHALPSGESARNHKKRLISRHRNSKGGNQNEGSSQGSTNEDDSTSTGSGDGSGSGSGGHGGHHHQHQSQSGGDSSSDSSNQSGDDSSSKSNGSNSSDSDSSSKSDQSSSDEGSSSSKSGDDVTSSTTSSKPSASTTSSSTSSSSDSGAILGQATWFTQDGTTGACGIKHSDSDFVVAEQTSRYGSGGDCGKQVKITNLANQKSVTATVADECPGCLNANALDLSVAAFEAIGDLDTGILQISWEFI